MSWFARHKILTAASVLVGLLVVGSFVPDHMEEPTAPSERPEDSRAETSPERGRYAVLDVIDGDTIEVAYRGGERVRVIGIDAPESVHPTVPEECWGRVAARAAERMLSGTEVTLVFDRSQARRDTFGRLLAYVEAPGVGDFGLAMLRSGHAAEYTYDTTYRRRASYRRAEAAARDAGRAMWEQCGGPDLTLVSPEPQPEPRPRQDRDCVPGYVPCVPPYTPDLSGNRPPRLQATTQTTAPALAGARAVVQVAGQGWTSSRRPLRVSASPIGW